MSNWIKVKPNQINIGNTVISNRISLKSGKWILNDTPKYNSYYDLNKFTLMVPESKEIYVPYNDQPWYGALMYGNYIPSPNTVFGSKGSIRSILTNGRKFGVFKYSNGAIFIIKMTDDLKLSGDKLVRPMSYNTLGHCIESKVCDKKMDDISLCLIEHNLNNLKVILTSEVDVYGDDNNPIEITCIPKNKELLKSKYISAYLGGCKEIYIFKYKKNYHTNKVTVDIKTSLKVKSKTNVITPLYTRLNYIKTNVAPMELCIFKTFKSRIERVNTITSLEQMLLIKAKNSIMKCIKNKETLPSSSKTTS